MTSFFSNISSKTWVILGVGTAGALYVLYEYRCSKIAEQVMEYDLSMLSSYDTDIQRDAIGNILQHASESKSVLRKLCARDSVLRDLRGLVLSTDFDTQFAAIDLVALMAEEERNLSKIRDAGLFQALVSVISSPLQMDNEIIEGAMIAIRNCTRPTIRTLQDPTTGNIMRVQADQIPRDRNDNVYDRDDEYFSRELYQLHGLEPVVSKLLSEDEDIQALALEIITNYCRIWKNKEEVGELGGLEYIAMMLGSPASAGVQGLALDALFHCIKHCECNQHQLRRTKATGALLSFLHSTNSGATQTNRKDIMKAIYILSKIIDREGATQIRKENLIPQLVQYLESDDEELSAVTKDLIRIINPLDPGCRQNFQSP